MVFSAAVTERRDGLQGVREMGSLLGDRYMKDCFWGGEPLAPRKERIRAN